MKHISSKTAMRKCLTFMLGLFMVLGSINLPIGAPLRMEVKAAVVKSGQFRFDRAVRGAAAAGFPWDAEHRRTAKLQMGRIIV